MATEALISRSLGSLANGISQQPPLLRLTSQAEKQEDCLSTVVDGVRRRPPMEHIAGPADDDLPTTVPTGGFFTHIIDRDTTERYYVLVEDDDLEVYDFDGNQAIMTFSDGDMTDASTDGYLGFNTSATSAKAVFAAFTVADHTFILNKDIVAALSASQATARPHEFLIHVKQIPSGGGWRVELVLDGVTERYVATGPGTNPTRDGLWDLLTGTDVTNGPADGVDNSGGTGADWTDWEFTRLSTNVIYGEQVTTVNGAAQLIEHTDNFGDQMLALAFKTIENFSDLPRVAKHDFTIRVLGESGNEEAAYWVKYDEAGMLWKETVGFNSSDGITGLFNSFDSKTMPHLLVRTNTDPLTFDYRKGVWADRLKGEDLSAPTPLFVGETIRDIIYHKRRLGFLSGEAVILSEAAGTFNFWPTTVLVVKDSDPLEITSTTNGVSLQDFAVPFRGNMMVFSSEGGTQMELTGADLTLTPSSAVLSEVGAYESTRKVAPTAVGQALYFAVDQVTASEVYEWLASGRTNASPEPITSHIPTYIPGNLRWHSSSTIESTLVYVSEDDLDAIYVYRFYRTQGAKIQASWSRWNIGGGGSVLGTGFLRSKLYVVLSRSDGVYIETIDFRKLTDGALPSRIHLDSLVEETGVYAAATDLTTWTLPYKPVGTESYEVVLSHTDWGTELGKVLVTTFNSSLLTVTAEGDWSAQAVHIGRVYNSIYGFSPATMETSGGGGGTAGGASVAEPVTQGRLQLKRWKVLFEDTGAFLMRVIRRVDNSDIQQDEVFPGRVVAGEESLIGALSLRQGDESVDAFGESTEILVEVHSRSYQPFTLTGAEWMGYYTAKSNAV